VGRDASWNRDVVADDADEDVWPENTAVRIDVGSVNDWTYN